MVGALWWNFGPKAPPRPQAQPQTAADHFDQFEAYGDYPDHFDHAWVMSADWCYCMGVAIAIHGNEYFYWMYSDSGFDCGPLRGAFNIDEDRLILEDPRTDNPQDTRQENVSELRLYSKEWVIHRDKLGMRLYAPADGVEDIGRHLLVDTEFNPKHPFQNQERLRSEPAEDVDPPEPYQRLDYPSETWKELRERHERHKYGFRDSFPMRSGALGTGKAGGPDLSLDLNGDRNDESHPPNKPVEGAATSPAVESRPNPPQPHL